MKTRDIRTAGTDLHLTCDVCGRTLLRGERSHPYLEGGEHRTVCELCTARAQHEGWIREGTMPAYDGRDSSSHRRRPLFGRLRRARPALPDAGPEPEEPVPDLAPAPPPRPVSERPRAAPERPRPPAGEPRHVRAIPSSLEQRVAAAADAFNASEHPRTIAGIGRSLGLPIASIRAAETSPGTVRILLAWELCWYRYETDLRDDSATVRLNDQGSELDELDPSELEPNATADENGLIRLDA